jgi:hypothetical protein
LLSTGTGFSAILASWYGANSGIETAPACSQRWFFGIFGFGRGSHELKAAAKKKPTDRLAFEEVRCGTRGSELLTAYAAPVSWLQGAEEIQELLFLAGA